MSIKSENKALTETELSIIKENAIKHYSYFSEQLAATFKKLADFNASGYSYAFRNHYMYHMLQEFADRWFDYYQKDPDAMVTNYFNGDVTRYVKKVNNDISHAKNIIIKFYLSFIKVYPFIIQITPNDEEFFEEVKSDIDALDNENLIDAFDRSTIQKLNFDQKCDLDDIFEEVESIA